MFLTCMLKFIKKYKSLSIIKIIIIKQGPTHTFSSCKIKFCLIVLKLLNF